MLKILICECTETNCAQLVSELYGTYFVRHVFNTPEAEFTIFPPYFSDQCITCPVARSGELASILETCPAPTLTPA